MATEAQSETLLLQYTGAPLFFLRRLERLKSQGLVEAEAEISEEYQTTLRYLRERILSEKQRSFEARSTEKPCIMCQRPLHSEDWLYHNLPNVLLTYVCDSCGWWFTSLSYDDEDWHQMVYYPGVLLDMYNVADSALPIDLCSVNWTRDQESCIR